MEQTITHTATLHILYAEHPVAPGDHFVEIRQWQASGDDYTELVIETGQLNEDGDLITTCHVLPYYFTLGDVIAHAMG
ncbi:MAG: hypothetical protein M9941_10325 [Anaerolineae bacterium]|nr:hypothetical protein [Anaerolineae bacterium]MCO5198122.1 hypothetical protein [Anaerolineae bacterium]